MRHLTPRARSLVARHGLSALVAINALSAIAAVWLASRQPFPDAVGYVSMADGVRHGQFSSWWFLPDAYPETLRMPGYPLFLAAIRALSESTGFLFAVQLALHLGALLFLARCVARAWGEPARLWLLGLTALNIQVPYLAGFVSSDSLTASLVMVWGALLLRPARLSTALLMGLVAGLASLTRPAFLPLPWGLLLIGLLVARARWRQLLLQASLATAVLLPFGAWNLSHHGVFRLTPIEGGAGAAHLGYWNFLLPGGYADRFYWGNAFPEDVFNPISPAPGAGQEAIAAYEREWLEIAKHLEAFETDEDRARLAAMRAQNPGMVVTRSTRYTLAREAALRRAVLGHIRERPVFYLSTRLYTFVRSYFTGVNAAQWRAAGWKERLKLAVPPGLQILFIVGGLVLSVVAVISRRRSTPPEALLLLAMVIGVGLIHTPFVIGSRYTMPVHFLLLAGVARILAQRAAGPEAERPPSS